MVISRSQANGREPVLRSIATSRISDVQLHPPHGNGLEIALLSGRLKAGPFELRGDIARGALISGRSGVAAFHAVVRERGDVVPPVAGCVIWFGGGE